MKGRKLGRVLTKLGHVTREQVHEALAIQKTRRVPIGQLLIELGYCSERDVSEGLAGQAGMAYVDLSKMEIPEEALAAIPSENAQTYQVVPIEFNPKSKRLKIALKSPDNFRAVDDLRLLMGFNVEAVVADAAAIDSLIQKHYSKTESVMDVVSGLAADDRFKALDKGGASIDLDAVLEAAEDNQVIKLLNLVLLQAIKDRASDIHFEPFENEFKMRYRIDGVLYEMVPPPKHLGPAITSRIKVMSHLDIAERRLPQDGRIELMVGGNPVDLRVAVLPTMWGESVVMRVLDRSNVELSLERIGFREDDLARFRKLIQKPNGIVIVTGPTGSGKTTTLYAALAELNDVETKILTAEDPVEYDIDGLCQCQMNEEVGLTFARALRSFLRQDPDIILVGEIRDLETAQIAVQASLTGHLVLTTLHTNDAPSSIIRLVDLGLEAFLLTATLEGIVAQRLVRTICPKCREEYTPTEEELMELALTPETVRGRRFFRGRGCDNCHKSGFRGRMALFEIMEIDDAMRELVMQEVSTSVLRDHAKRRGMRSLRDAGLLAIYEGQTTIDEVVRETIAEED
ncbi:MAG: pilus assembly protein PilB [Leptolyngbya sp. PLA2]|nr:pilus assembly protein PilB [Leptolyngbya sp.]MCE7971657.1 pilus assembly protein PilB [Leptolyngbya sp. PL-A2]MCQ3940024.1 pilus assembly protein PilB [cyanobacterium CYA1]MDL1903234.1 pilus assembly protein PilB [Synechococcales cyanobacterium CNB]